MARAMDEKIGKTYEDALKRIGVNYEFVDGAHRFLVDEELEMGLLDVEQARAYAIGVLDGHNMLKEEIIAKIRRLEEEIES